MVAPPLVSIPFRLQILLSHDLPPNQKHWALQLHELASFQTSEGRGPAVSDKLASAFFFP